MFGWFRWFVRLNGCKWCGRWITMREVEHDKWLAFEMNGREHRCPRRPRLDATPSGPNRRRHWRRKSEGWGSHPWRSATSEMERRLIAICVIAVLLLAILLR
jgi:hypothetical protein